MIKVRLVPGSLQGYEAYHFARAYFLPKWYIVLHFPAKNHNPCEECLHTPLPTAQLVADKPTESQSDRWLPEVNSGFSVGAEGAKRAHFLA